MSYRNPTLIRDTSYAAWAEMSKTIGQQFVNIAKARADFLQKQKENAAKNQKLDAALDTEFRQAWNKEIIEGKKYVLSELKEQGIEGTKAITLAEQWFKDSSDTAQLMINKQKAIATGKLGAKERQDYQNEIMSFQNYLGTSGAAVANYQGYMEDYGKDGNLVLENHFLVGDTMTEKVNNALYIFGDANVSNGIDGVIVKKDYDLKRGEDGTYGNFTNIKTKIPVNSSFLSRIKDATGDALFKDFDANGVKKETIDGQEYYVFEKGLLVDTLGEGNNVLTSQVMKGEDLTEVWREAGVMDSKTNTFDTAYMSSKPIKSTAVENGVQYTSTKTIVNLGKIAQISETRNMIDGEAAALLTASKPIFNGTLNNLYNRSSWGNLTPDGVMISSDENMYDGIHRISNLDARQSVLGDIMFFEKMQNISQQDDRGLSSAFTVEQNGQLVQATVQTEDEAAELNATGTLNSLGKAYTVGDTYYYQVETSGEKIEVDTESEKSKVENEKQQAILNRIDTAYKDTYKEEIAKSFLSGSEDVINKTIAGFVKDLGFGNEVSGYRSGDEVGVNIKITGKKSGEDILKIPAGTSPDVALARIKYALTGDIRHLGTRIK